MNEVELMDLRKRVERGEYRVDEDQVAGAIVRRILERSYRSSEVLEAAQPAVTAGDRDS